MTDKPTLTTIPGAEDDLRASFEALKRMLPIMAEIGPQIAAARWQMFQHHLKAGFTEAQALELCKSLSI